MGYSGQVLTMPLNMSGYQSGRDKELLEMPALVDPTRNVNYHQNGIGKRGGTAWHLLAALSGNPTIRGGYQFRLLNGNKFIVFATSEGKIYHTNSSNVLKTGMSTTEFFHFSYLSGNLYIADGNSLPQYWAGSAASTSGVTPPTDWATTGYPFQFVQHAARAGGIARNWAVCKNGVYAAKIDDGTDFSDPNVEFIPVSAAGGLVAGWDFGGVFFVFSKTKAWAIDDSDVDPANWGAREVIWEGGAAHWRLIVKAMNDLEIMTEEGLVYSIRGVQATGDYVASALTRPAFIDNYIQNNVRLSDINKFHCCYDRKLRAVKWFIETGDATNTNQALVQFIDRPIEKAWAIHDNEDNASGYNAACSFEVQAAVGDWQVYTGDFSGMIWKLEQSTKSDNGNAYRAPIRWKPFDFGKARMWKHFKRCSLRTAAQGNFTLTVRIWIDGVRKADKELSVAGSGAAFDTALFDSSVFADDGIFPSKFAIGGYGYKLELEIDNAEAGEDFFHSQIMFDIKELGIR